MRRPFVGLLVLAVAVVIGLSTMGATSAARPPLCPINPPAGVAFAWNVTYVTENESGDVSEAFEVDLLGGPAAGPIVAQFEGMGAHVTGLYRTVRPYGIVKQTQ